MTQIQIPLVSIVTPSLNQARFLEKSIQSVLLQDYPRIEYIVVDGGSTDGSVEIIQRYSDRLACWITEPDAGQAAAINKGLSRATGEIVAWLNSDDLYLAGAVREAVETLEAHPEAGMVYADGVVIDEFDRLLDRHRYRSLRAIDLLSFEVLLQPTVFMRRAILDEAGLLDASYHLILDHELWLRMSLRRPIVHVPKYWAVERTHPEAKTIGQSSLFVEEAERMLEKAKSSDDCAQVINAHRKQIQVGLHLFAGRRLIDGKEYTNAARRFRLAMSLSPRQALRFWYKLGQVALGLAGLDRLFLTYRNLRRQLQFRTGYVVLTPRGAELEFTREAGQVRRSRG